MRLLLLLLACASCGPALQWKPRTEGAADLAELKQPARRAKRKDVRECDELGMVLADGAPDSGMMDAISREAAKRGGTHYVVKDDETDRDLVIVGNSTGIVGTTQDGDRHVATIIYRCP